jgi:hypothetical protein
MLKIKEFSTTYYFDFDRSDKQYSDFMNQIDERIHETRADGNKLICVEKPHACVENMFDGTLRQEVKATFAPIEQPLRSTNKQSFTFCGCSGNDIKENIINGHKITICKCGNMGINPPQNKKHLS